MQRYYLIIITAIFSIIASVAAAQSTDDRIKLMNAARNICTGVIAKFVDTPDPESEITYDQGKFKIVRTKTGATVLEDSVKVTEIQKLDYGTYQTCIDHVLNGIH